MNFVEERSIAAATALILLIGLFLNLGKQPLFLEEPRRVLVTMEMEENRDWIAPTQLGDPYFNKPPGFNWVLLVTKWALGPLNEWKARLPTVLSTVLLSLIIFLLNTRYLNAEGARLASLLFVSSAGILFYFSTLAEIDLYYSLLTFAGIAGIYHFDRQERPFLLFVNLYVLGALGFLTKGLPSVVFIGASLLTYFGYQKRLKSLLSLPHFCGLLGFTAILGAYFWVLSRSHSPDQLMTILWGQSSERTVIDQGIWPLFQHLLTFPLAVIGDIMPGGLLLLFALRRDLPKILREKEWVRFCTWMFAANFIVYWISPGARLRYIYMLYPFLLTVLVYLYQRRHEIGPSLARGFTRGLQVISGLLSLGVLVLPFLPELQFMPHRWAITGGAFIVFAGLFVLSLRQQEKSLSILLLILACGRVVFDLTVLPQRAFDSGAQEGRDAARAIHAIVKDDPLYILNDGRFSFTVVVYLNMLRGSTLRRTYAPPDPDSYYISHDSLLTKPHQSFYEMDYHSAIYRLVRFDR